MSDKSKSIDNLEKISEMLETGIIMHMQNGLEQCDTQEMGSIIDMIKDLAEAKYKCTVTKAMEEYPTPSMDEESEMGERFYSRGMMGRRHYYSENDMKHYTEPNYQMNTKMYHEHTPEQMRDMDRKNGRMYFTEMHNDVVSPYDNAKKHYTENKKMNPNDTQGNLKAIETLSNVIAEDIKEMTPKMNASEKTMLRQKMQNMINDIQ